MGAPIHMGTKTTMRTQLCILALALFGTLVSIPTASSAAQRPSRRLQQAAAPSPSASANTVTVPTCPIWNDPCQATLQADRPASCHGEPNMYTELSATELVAVRDFLLNVTKLNLTATSEAEPRDNYIYTIYLEPPPKKEALNYLDKNGTKPVRTAVARLMMGKLNPPVVKHVRVWPVEKPTNWAWTPIHQNKMSVPWIQRPLTSPETRYWGDIQDKAFKTLNPFFIKEWFGWHWCSEGETEKCLTTNSNAPGSTDANFRGQWSYFLRAVDGFWINGMGSMFVRYNSTNLDPSKWAIDGIMYDGVLYGSAQEFMDAYNAGEVAVITPEIPKDDAEAIYSTFNTRPNPRNPSQPLAPLIYDPQGRRFKITNYNKVEWMGWSLFLGSHPLHGPRLHDVRFKGERIAYEVALQEAMATYGAGLKDPVQALTLYLDSHWGLGADMKELMHGVDCPSNAAYIDLTTMYDGYDGVSDEPRHVRNALCVFEMPTSRAVLRHFEHDFNGHFDWWGATKESVLMIRGIFTVGNYDYMIDVVLHGDGSFEMTTSTSGYPQATNYKKGTTRGFPLWKDVAGSLHEHVLFYKIDVDLIDSSNSVQMHQFKAQVMNNTYLGKKVVNKQLVTSFVNTESAIKYQFNKPMIMTVVNEKEKNSFGTMRGYSFKVDRPLYSIIGEDNLDSPYIGAIDWSKYWFAVTQQHDNEPFGSGAAYHQMVPSATPVVSFDKMVDGESVRDEDVVVWLTSGLFHLTTSEDAPVTTITGNNLGFIMRPFNWGDENGSSDLPDMTMIKSSEVGTKMPATQEFLYGPNNCMPPVEKIVYNGNYTGWSLNA